MTRKELYEALKANKLFDVRVKHALWDRLLRSTIKKPVKGYRQVVGDAGPRSEAGYRHDGALSDLLR